MAGEDQVIAAASGEPIVAAEPVQIPVIVGVATQLHVVAGKSRGVVIEKGPEGDAEGADFNLSPDDARQGRIEKALKTAQVEAAPDLQVDTDRRGKA